MSRRSLLSPRGTAAAQRVATCVVAGTLMASGAVVELAVPPAARATEQVNACGGRDAALLNNIFTGYSTFGITYADQCGVPGSGLVLVQDGVNTERPGQAAGWVANAPAGLAIVGANVPALTVNNVLGTGYLAYFYWNGGGGPDRVTGNVSFSTGFPPSSAFGFLLECDPSGGTCPADGANFNVEDVQLTVAEDPSSISVIALDGNNLWYRGALGYVRGGGWSIAYTASAPSGILSMAASVNGTAVGVPPAGGWCTSRDSTVWQQCPGTQTFSPIVSLNGNGDQQLTIGATTAAGNTPSPTETIHVDNTQPRISLSGPTQASPSAGTQYLTAAAALGPSGLSSIDCSADGGPVQSYSSSPAMIPVSGLGMHSVRCTATNQSYSSHGQPATSTPATWQLDIAQPTVSGISFSNIIHSLKCKRVRQRIRIAARSVTVHRRGKLVTVHRRARTKVVKVVKCHPRIVKRTVTVVVKKKRHGRTILVKRRKVERVALPPKLVSEPVKRIAFGKGTAVSGILVTPDGIALPGRTVAVLTAPNNGLGAWTQAAMVTTGADGVWTASLPPGPSRLVEATYAGDSTTLPSTSAAIHLVVPAKVKIHILPRSTRWGGTIHIAGRVLGGFIPAGKLLRLRIGVAGVHETVGIPSVRPNGRFHTTWKFAAGRGVVRYWFSISTLSEADYPYAPGSSRRVYVRVGPG